jgi:hypothetical protein
MTERGKTRHRHQPHPRTYSTLAPYHVRKPYHSASPNLRQFLAVQRVDMTDVEMQVPAAEVSARQMRAGYDMCVHARCALRTKATAVGGVKRASPTSTRDTLVTWLETKKDGMPFSGWPLLSQMSRESIFVETRTGCAVWKGWWLAGGVTGCTIM